MRHMEGLILAIDLFSDSQVPHLLVLCFLQAWMGTQQQAEASILTTVKIY
jgi:hypothetical protein